MIIFLLDYDPVLGVHFDPDSVTVTPVTSFVPAFASTLTSIDPVLDIVTVIGWSLSAAELSVG